MAQKTSLPSITGDIDRINFSIDDFKRIREKRFLYVDKTKLIADLLTYDEEKAILFTRPRRFGKSMNLSMLRCFFDMSENTRNLFRGLYIEKTKFFETHLNQYPVLYLNFKDISPTAAVDLEKEIICSLQTQVRALYQKYPYQELKNISFETRSGGVRVGGIKDVTRVLFEQTGTRVIALVDEYDSVINQTYGTDAWDDAAGVIKRLFGMLLKTNEYLEMGIMTGVSKIGRELGFSDMNNLSVCGLTKKRYYEYFGFTEAEVKELLHQNKIELSDMFYRMYNGYHFGNTPNMFNPASILKFLYDFQDTREAEPGPYWINSATNRILKANIAKQDTRFKDSLLRLLDGGTIIEPIFDSIDYDMLDKPSYLYSLLIDTGYLCPIRKISGNLFELKIPNEEVLYGYLDMIDLVAGVEGTILRSLCTNLCEGNIPRFEQTLNEILLNVASFHDFSEKENSYHNLVMGALLYLLGTFHVRSNRESGHGRYDIAMVPNEPFKVKYRPMILEFKTARDEREYSDGQLLALAKAALEQIKNKQYSAGYAPIYQQEDFLLIGIGTQGKRCRVVSYP